MIESSERTVIDQVVETLAHKSPSVPREQVADVVRDISLLARFRLHHQWTRVVLRARGRQCGY